MADRQEKKPRIGIVTALGKTKLPWVDIPTVCVHRKYIEAVEKKRRNTVASFGDRKSGCIGISV